MWSHNGTACEGSMVLADCASCSVIIQHGAAASLAMDQDVYIACCVNTTGVAGLPWVQSSTGEMLSAESVCASAHGRPIDVFCFVEALPAGYHSSAQVRLQQQEAGAHDSWHCKRTQLALQQISSRL